MLLTLGNSSLSFATCLSSSTIFIFLIFYRLSFIDFRHSDVLFNLLFGLFVSFFFSSRRKEPLREIPQYFYSPRSSISPTRVFLSYIDIDLAEQIASACLLNCSFPRSLHSFDFWRKEHPNLLPRNIVIAIYSQLSTRSADSLVIHDARITFCDNCFNCFSSPCRRLASLVFHIPLLLSFLNTILHTVHVLPSVFNALTADVRLISSRSCHLHHMSLLFPS